MWAMFASDPVSRLSTQITRLPRASSSSHRCEPRKPAPPVTRQVDIPASLVIPSPTDLVIARTILPVMSATEEERLTVAPIVGPDDPRRFTDSGIEITELYTEADVPAELDLGEPGAFP